MNNDWLLDLSSVLLCSNQIVVSDWFLQRKSAQNNQSWDSSLMLPSEVSDTYSLKTNFHGPSVIKTNIKSNLFGPSRGEVFQLLSNPYKNEEGKRFGKHSLQQPDHMLLKTVITLTGSPFLHQMWINNHQIPATMQTITLKNCSINEIVEGKQGHATIKTSCKHQ